MEGIIKVDPQKLISTADEFNGTGNQIKSLTDNMISIIDSLRSVWEGAGATAYNTKFHQLQDDMDKMHRMIQEHVKDLNEMARQYDLGEKKVVDTSNSLESNPLP